MKSYLLRIQDNKHDDFVRFMNDYEIVENHMFNNGIIKILVNENCVALEIDSEKMQNIILGMIDEYAKQNFTENTATCIRVDKDDYIEIKELLRHEFDRIIRSISKDDYLKIIKGSRRVYDSTFFKNLILSKFSVTDYFERVANVGFTCDGNVIYRGDVLTNLTDAIDEFSYPLFDENAAIINRLANLAGVFISQYNKDIILNNACTEIVIYDNYDIALSNYVVNDNTKKRMNEIGNKEVVYVADIYDSLSEESRSKIDEEERESSTNYGPETTKFYKLCERYAHNESNFKENPDEFNRLLSNLVYANRLTKK